MWTTKCYMVMASQAVNYFVDYIGNDFRVEITKYYISALVTLHFDQNYS